MTQSNTLTSVHLTLAYLVEQPIIHTEETVGNISKIKKLRVMDGDKAVLVPALSGNSFRGQLRDILADRMFEVLSNNGQQLITFTNNEVYGAIYSGGALRDDSALAGVMKSLTDTIPAIRLMGAAFGNVMWPSKLAVTHAIPCTQETRGVLEAVAQKVSIGILPKMEQWPKTRDLIFNDGPLTRKDDRRDPARRRFTNPGPIPETGSEDRQQMIYYIECISPGTWLLQQIYTKYPLDNLELGCLFDGLDMWLQAPSLGGRSAAGYGQVRVYIHGNVANEGISWPDKWPEIVKTGIETYRTSLINKEELLKALQAQAQEMTGEQAQTGQN